MVDYAEHALGQGADATAVAYVETAHGADASLRWGVGVHPNIITASLMRRAVRAGGRQGRRGTHRAHGRLSRSGPRAGRVRSR